MSRAPNTILLIGLLYLTVVFLAIGCSDNSSPLSSTDPAQPQASSLSSILPPLTDDELQAGPAEGFSFVKVDLEQAAQVPSRRSENRLDYGDWNGPGMVSQWMTIEWGGYLYDYCGHDCWIPQWMLPYDTLVTISTPNPGWAIADYGPHPTQFNGMVEIGLCLYGVQLPEGADPRELTIWYINDDGEWEYIGGEFWPPYWFVAQTDHFSRYILARRDD